MYRCNVVITPLPLTHREIYISTERYISPKRYIFLQRVIYAPIFKSNQQQDAYEMLLVFLNQLHKENPYRISAGLLNQFKGEMNYYMECQNCEEKTETSKMFQDLSLPIPSKSTKLETCLEKHLSHDNISGYYCQNCQKKTAAKRYSKLMR